MLLSLDPISYLDKPHKEEIIEITRRIALHVVDLSVGELAEAVSLGKTFCCSIFKVCPQRGSRRRQEALFESAQLIALDFDSGIPEALPKPTILYTSFSHTEDKPKYRAVWFLSEPVTELAHYKALVKSFMQSIGMADPACKDAARLFFGSTSDCLVEINPEVILEVGTIPIVLPKKSTAREFASGETEAEQREILFKLKPVYRRFLVNLVRELLDSLKTFDGTGGSRYQQLWSTTANLCLIPELLPLVVGSWVAKAVEQNPYYADWDKDVEETISSAISWAETKRA